MTLKKIPLVDLKAQYAAHKAEIDAAIARVIENTAFIGGAEVAHFETAFAAFCEAPAAIGCGNGTDAIALALKGLGIGPGDEVVVPSMTFIATAEAVEMVGARPVFADVSPDTLLMGPAEAEAALTPKTRALLPVHLFGQPCDMPGLMALAKKHGLKVIEDAAQAHGARIEGQRIGSFGDAATFSFYPGKNLGAYGDGGAVTTHDPDLAAWLRKARNHGRAKKYAHDFSGVNSRLDGLQAAILGAKLPHLDTWSERRRERASWYDAWIAEEVPEATPIARRSGTTHVFHLYVIRVPNRDAVLEGLKARGIMAGVHYPIALHQQPAYAAWELTDEMLPNTAAGCAQILSLPMYPELEKSAARTVITALKAAIAQSLSES